MSSSKKEQSSEPPSLLQSLPNDIIIDILSRVQRCYYRTLSLVSKHFRSLVASHELYVRRSQLGCTERRLYLSLTDRENSYHNPYILYHKANGDHRLVLISPWTTSMPYVGSFVTVGSKIYVFDRLNRYHHLPVPSIESRFQTVHLLPCMNDVTMSVSVAGIIDGKIYVLGCCIISREAKMVMAVFNTDTQVWEFATETMIGRPYGCVVMAGKMYTRDRVNSFVYDPKESKWETDKTLNLYKWEDGCVVDDVLYYYDTLEKVLKAYNPRERNWVVVKGLEILVDVARSSSGSSYIGSYGGKLALFLCRHWRINDIWCAVISVERRHHGSEIWGKIDSCDSVLFDCDDLFVTKTLDVIV